MKPLHIETPLVQSLALSDIIGKKVFLKLESMQPPGSFKIRGIGLHCQRLVEAGAEEFVSYSGGNAGLATVYAGKKLGKKTTVFVPSTTPQNMRDLIQESGGELQVVEDPSQTEKAARSFASEPGRAYIHPFDHDDIFEGHATLIEECGDFRPDAVVVSVGGGGLLSGLLTGYQKFGWNPKTVYCEPEGAQTLTLALEKGEIVRIPKVNTLCTSLGAHSVAQKTLDFSKEFELLPHIVTDQQAIQGAIRFADDHRILVEPACGAALSAIYDQSKHLSDVDTILVMWIQS